MDRVGADFYRCLAMLKERLGAHPVPIQIPIGREEHFRGVVNLIEQNAFVWDETDETLGTKYTVQDIPADMLPLVKEYREKMIEGLAEVDEHLMEKYLGEEKITPEEIKAAVRAGTISMKLFPVICGASFKNKGVQPMLDCVVDYLPSPLDIPPMQGVNPDTGETVTRAAPCHGAVLRAGVQDHERSVRGAARVRAGVLRHAQLRLGRVQLDPGEEGARRSPRPHARQQA